jgi:deoxyribose-phosphate aldolase
VRNNPISAEKIFSLIDLTRLEEKDTEQEIAPLISQATSSLGHVAAVCVFPRFVSYVASALRDTPIHIAAVANFPHGEEARDDILATIQQACKEGANEIDLVFPYRRYLAGDKTSLEEVRLAKEICGETTCLKVILETGVYPNDSVIYQSSREILLAGADFIKTSTGKLSRGATLTASKAMLLAIQSLASSVKRPLGLKVSGGIKTREVAEQFIHQAIQMMGESWVTPRFFRIGSSRLFVSG